MLTVSNILQDAALELAAISETPRLDAELLLAQVLKVERSFFYTHPLQKISCDEEKRFKEVLQRRLQNEPMAYILGKQEFWSLNFNVTKDVLIPRHDTELLVELALQKLAKDLPLRILDLGTGSGAIACALAHTRPNWQVVATDQNANALKVAEKNAQKLNLKNVEFYLGDWFLALKNCGKNEANFFDAIISNPPYVALNDPNLEKNVLAFEPREALFSGEDGLDAIRIIIKNARHYLKKDGLLFLEHGFTQQSQVIDLFLQHGYGEVQGYLDLAKNPRVVIGQNNCKMQID